MAKFYVIFALVLAIILFSSCSDSNPCDCDKTKITIAALLPLSGSGSSSGAGMKAALEIAKKEVEQYLDANNSESEFELIIVDTKTDPAEALNKLKELSDRGIKVFVGPYSSSEAQALKEYADANGLIILSPSSEAISLAIAGDNIFRFVPSDLFLAKAITRYSSDESLKRIIPIYRDDVWGNDLVNAYKNNLQISGASMAEGIKYNPASTDYHQITYELNEIVKSELNSYAAGEIAVFMASFGEGTQILNGASYQIDLAKVKWIGSSAYANDNSIVMVSNWKSGGFAYQQELVCPIWGYDVDAMPKAKQLLEEIEKEIGHEPDIYALTAYDAMWVGVKTLLATGQGASEADLKSNLVVQAAQYNGATGNTSLNDEGDRIKGDYDFWGLGYDEVSVLFYWQKVATYLADQDIIVK